MVCRENFESIRGVLRYRLNRLEAELQILRPERDKSLAEWKHFKLKVENLEKICRDLKNELTNLRRVEIELERDYMKELEEEASE